MARKELHTINLAMMPLKVAWEAVGRRALLRGSPIYSIRCLAIWEGGVEVAAMVTVDPTSVIIYLLVWRKLSLGAKPK